MTPHPRSLCLSIALLLSATAIAWPQTPAPPPEEEHVVRSFPLAPGGTLAVENFKGTIHIAGSSGDQVVVTADRRFEGSDSDRRWWMAGTHVSFESQPDRLRVAVEYPTVSCDLPGGGPEHSEYSGVVELTIRVPRRVNLDLSGHKPDIRIADTEGDIRIQSYKSPIEIASTTGGVSIQTM